MNNFQQSQACAYISGAMPREEREQFELLLEFDPELRVWTGQMADAGAALVMASQPAASGPATALKARIAGLISGRPQQTVAEGLVISGLDGLVQWVNPAFTGMCGHTLDELKGKKLGPILQGADTDRATADRMRVAVHERRPCRETILNYHKNGTPSLVEIAITPIVDAEGRPMLLAAREREIKEQAAA
jgi:PAS domain S-box-containing protein